MSNGAPGVPGDGGSHAGGSDGSVVVGGLYGSGFLNPDPKALPVPAVLSALVMAMTNALALTIPQLTEAEIALGLSFMIGSFLWLRMHESWGTKLGLWFINSLILFTMTVGINALGNTVESPVTPIVSSIKPFEKMDQIVSKKHLQDFVDGSRQAAPAAAAPVAGAAGVAPVAVPAAPAAPAVSAAQVAPPAPTVQVAPAAPAAAAPAAQMTPTITPVDTATPEATNTATATSPAP